MVVVKYAASHLIPKDKDNKEDRKAIARSRSTYTRCHFKNTREVCRAVRGMKLSKALTYLGDVMEHKQCIPFTRYAGGIGRTAQAKHFGTTKGRWPVKSVKYIRALLKNAQSNAEASELNVEDLMVTNIFVNQSPKTRRRTYRAHGRINPYEGHPCHIEIILTPLGEEVEKAEESMDIEPKRRTRAPKKITAA